MTSDPRHSRRQIPRSPAGSVWRGVKAVFWWLVGLLFVIEVIIQIVQGH